MRRNRLFVLLSLVVAVAMLLACTAPAAPAAAPAGGEAAAGGDSAAAAATTEAGKTKLTWLTLSGWDPDGKVQAMFEEENPDIDLVLEQVGFNDLFQQIQIRLSSGSALPDVLSVDVPVTSGYGVRNWLAPLDDLFSEADKADMLEAAIEAGSHEGHLISAPLSTSTQLLFINKDLFDAAGVPVPGPDDRLTYEQIAEMAPKLTQDTDGDGVTDVWGFTWEQTNRIYQLQAMEESLGGDAISADGLTVEGIINAQPWVDAYTYYGKAFTDGKFAPPSDTNAQELFEQGKLAMMIAGPWNIRRYTEANDGQGPALYLDRIAPSVLPERRDRDSHRFMARRHQCQEREHGCSAPLRQVAGDRQGRRGMVAVWQRRLPGAEVRTGAVPDGSAVQRRYVDLYEGGGRRGDGQPGAACQDAWVPGIRTDPAVDVHGHQPGRRRAGGTRHGSAAHSA